MRVTRCVAGVMGAALLFGACASGGAGGRRNGCSCHGRSPIPTLSPPLGALARPVWRLPDLYASEVAAVGDAIVAVDGRHDQLIFVDVATGQVRAKQPIPRDAAKPPTLRAEEDARGRPMAVLSTPLGLAKNALERVYDPDGHLIWRSTTRGAAYVGGFVFFTRPSISGPADLVVRDLAGHELTRRPAEDGELHPLPLAVWPGWLATAGLQSSSRVSLLDLRSPRRPRWIEVVPPAHDHSAGGLVAAGGRLYVNWQRSINTEEIASYSAPGRPPVWSTVLGDGTEHLSEALADPHTHAGGLIIADKGNLKGILDGRTGKWRIPFGGWPSTFEAISVYRNRLYASNDAGDRPTTVVTNVYTGKTISTSPGWLRAATVDGHLIFDTTPGLTAYRLR
jgi:hypothetical protein